MEVLLFDIHGIRHAAWGDQVREIRDAGSVMRPPVSPDFMAGLTVLDGRTTVLADLGACLGLPPVSRKSPVQTLLLCGEDDPGFLVEGAVRRVRPPTSARRTLSGFLRLPLLAGVILLDGLPVPVIDLPAILARLRTGEGAPPAPEICPPAVRVRQFSRMRRFRLFTLGAEIFAAPAADLPKPAVISPVTSFGGLPPFIAGIAAVGSRTLPVLRLQTLLGLASGETDANLLPAGDAGAEFALAVQADGGEVRGEAVPLPPLVRSPGLTHALLDKEGIVPLLEPAALIAEESGEPPLPERYAPAEPRLPLGRKDLQELQEFNLLGARYSLPRSQVVDILPAPSWRPIPVSPPLVPGVAEFDDELWPVLDLAPYFGRTTRPGPGARVIAVRDGDFKALVLAEEVLGVRHVPAKEHRDLPFAIPHNLVLSCYVDAGSVILVLNIPALAVRFDPALVHIFQETLPTEERFPASPPEHAAAHEAPPPETDAKGLLTPSPLPETEPPIDVDTVQEPAPPRPEKSAEEASPTVPEETVIAPLLPPEEMEEPAVPAVVTDEPDELDEPDEPDEPVSVCPAEEETPEVEFPPLKEEPPQPPALAAPAWEPDADKGEETEAEKVGKTEVVEEEDAEATECPLPETPPEPVDALVEMPAAEADEEPPAPEETPIVIRLGWEPVVPVVPVAAAPDEIGEPEPMAEFPPFAPSDDQLPAETGWTTSAPPVAEPRQEEGPDPLPPAEGFPAAAGEEEPAPAVASEPAEADREQWAPPAPPFRPPSSPRRYGNPVVVVPLALLITGFLLWLSFSPDEPGGKTTVSSVAAVKPAPLPNPVPLSQETTTAGTAAGNAPAMPAGPAETAVPNTARSEAASAPQVLFPFPDRDDLYQVRRGDTLWDIAGRFTGNPFDYSRIAHSNEIRNPDLIYPGQRIAIPK